MRSAMHTELAVALLSRMIWLKAGLRVQVLCLLVRHVSGASDGGGHVPADGGHWAHAGHCHLHGLHCCPHCRHHVRLCGGLPTGMLTLTPSHCMRGGQCYSQNKQFSPRGSDHYRHHVWPCVLPTRRFVLRKTQTLQSWRTFISLYIKYMR